MKKIRVKHILPLAGAVLLVTGCNTVTTPDTQRIVEGVEIVGSGANVAETHLHGSLANCAFPNESCATVPNDDKGRVECIQKGGSFVPNQECRPKVIVKYYFSVLLRLFFLGLWNVLCVPAKLPMLQTRKPLRLE